MFNGNRRVNVKLWPHFRFHTTGIADLGEGVAHLCPTLFNPMDCSLPVSSVRGILQARILEWVGILFSRGSSEPSD